MCWWRLKPHLHLPFKEILSPLCHFFFFSSFLMIMSITGNTGSNCLFWESQVINNLICDMCIKWHKTMQYSSSVSVEVRFACRRTRTDAQTWTQTLDERIVWLLWSRCRTKCLDSRCWNRWRSGNFPLCPSVLFLILGLCFGFLFLFCCFLFFFLH